MKFLFRVDMLLFFCCFASPLMQHVQGPSEFKKILLDVSFVSVKTMCPTELFDCPLNSKIHFQVILESVGNILSGDHVNGRCRA